jgi:hypothetical protein
LEIRKLIATALTARDLSDDQLIETHNDRVWSFALIKDPLGQSLWRLWLTNDAAYYDRVLYLLSKRVQRASKRQLTRSVRERIVRCIVDEWLNSVCMQCQGRGGLVVDGTPHVRHVCTTCNATGVRPISATERAQHTNLRREHYESLEPVFDAAYRALQIADAAAARDVLAWLRGSGLGVASIPQVVEGDERSIALAA